MPSSQGLVMQMEECGGILHSPEEGVFRRTLGNARDLRLSRVTVGPTWPAGSCEGAAWFSPAGGGVQHLRRHGVPRLPAGGHQPGQDRLRGRQHQRQQGHGPLHPAEAFPRVPLPARQDQEQGGRPGPLVRSVRRHHSLASLPLLMCHPSCDTVPRLRAGVNHTMGVPGLCRLRGGAHVCMWS